MQLKDFARRLPDEVWALLEPILPPQTWGGNGRKPKTNRACFQALMYVLVPGLPWELWPVGLPSYKPVQRRLKLWLALDGFHPAGQQLATRYQACSGSNGAQVRLDGSKQPAKKGGQQPGPSPVVRGQGGTALQLACDGRAMPLGVVVTPANANDGCPTQELLAALGVPPPAPLPSPVESEGRSLPTAQADGAYGNRPARQRANAAGSRLHAPSRGQRPPGVGKIRHAVERCHHFCAQLGQIGRRLERSAERCLGWIELAACVIFLRSGFVR